MKIIKTSDLILKFNNIHKYRYDYSKVEYVNSKTKVCIICPEHGEFWQKHNNHLNGEGCPECGKARSISSYKKTVGNRRDWNFEQPEEYKLIPLTNGKFTMVSNEDFDRVKGINWCLSGIGYVKNTSKGLLSRFILNPPPILEVDHINGDTLDNRRTNLRLANREQNVHNTKAHRDCSSEFKGVSFCKNRKKWMAQISFKGNHYFLGRFCSEEDASRAYNEKALQLHKEFAKLNIIN